MPVVIPVGTGGGGLGDLGARLVVDDKDVVGVVVHLLAQVDVVEVRRILDAEEETHVAVTVVLDGRLQTHVQGKTANRDTLDHRAVERRTDRGLDLALRELAVDLASSRGANLPGLPIGRSPVVGTTRFEIVEEQQWQASRTGIHSLDPISSTR